MTQNFIFVILNWTVCTKTQCTRTDLTCIVFDIRYHHRYYLTKAWRRINASVNWVMIGSDDGLLPVLYQTNSCQRHMCWLSFRPLWTNGAVNPRNWKMLYIMRAIVLTKMTYRNFTKLQRLNIKKNPIIWPKMLSNYWLRKIRWIVLIEDIIFVFLFNWFLVIESVDERGFLFLI